MNTDELNRANDTKRIQAAVLSEGGRNVSFDDARNLWKRYSDFIGAKWTPVPDDAERIYSNIEWFIIEKEWYEAKAKN